MQFPPNKGSSGRFPGKERLSDKSILRAPPLKILDKWNGGGEMTKSIVQIVVYITYLCTPLKQQRVQYRGKNPERHNSGK